MRVVIDTNVWISSVLNPAGAPALVRAAFDAGRFTPVTSEPLLLELAEVLARPRFAQKYGVVAVDVAVLIDSLRELSEMAVVTGDLRLCRDPNDDMVIETGINGAADALVSRDDDLIRASDVAMVLADRGVTVLSVQRFLDVLETAEMPRQP